VASEGDRSEEESTMAAWAGEDGAGKVVLAAHRDDDVDDVSDGSYNKVGLLFGVLLDWPASIAACKSPAYLS
jgi:hypothetical protein